MSEGSNQRSKAQRRLYKINQLNKHCQGSNTCQAIPRRAQLENQLEIKKQHALRIELAQARVKGAKTQRLK
jgi:hypothetical protein